MGGKLFLYLHLYRVICLCSSLFPLLVCHSSTVWCGSGDDDENDVNDENDDDDKNDDDDDDDDEL